jgi:hypothetical protein
MVFNLNTPLNFIRGVFLSITENQMKILISKIVLVGLLSLVLISCGGKKPEAQASQQLSSDYNLPVVEVGEQKVSLKYQFTKGDKFKYRLSTISSSVQSVQADSSMKASSEQSLSYIFDVEVLGVDKDNVAEIALTMSNIKLNATVDGKKYNYESNSNLSKEEKQKFLKYESENNFTYKAHVTSGGKVLNVSDIEKLVDKMITYLPEKQNVPAQQKAELVNGIAQQEIRPITQLLFRELAINEVGKDSTWKKVTPSTLGLLNLENTENYKVENFVKVGDKKAAKVSVQLSTKWSGNKKGNQNGTDFTFDDPKVSGGGIILFDFGKGKLLKSETVSNFEMSVNMEMKDASQKTIKAKRTDTSMNKNIVEML